MCISEAISALVVLPFCLHLSFIVLNLHYNRTMRAKTEWQNQPKSPQKYTWT